jgi:hypothetical protein
MPRLLVAALLLASLTLGGCTDTPAKLCPTTSVVSGNYQLLLVLPDGGDTCRQIRLPDGGPADASLARTDPPVRNSSLCSEITDAGPVIYLAVEGATVARKASLDVDGGFVFVGESIENPVANETCGCSTLLAETITANLVAPGATGFVVDPDAGIVPRPTGIAGTVVDTLSSDAGACRCNIPPPCTMSYTLTGTPN